MKRIGSSKKLPLNSFPATKVSKKSKKGKKKIAKKPKRPKNIWTPEEDGKLLQLIDIHGPSHWSVISSEMKNREGKQCRERWHNHLNPIILKDSWTDEEDLRLFLLYRLYGSKWSILSHMFAGRTDNSIKNHWNSIMKKKIRRFDAQIKIILESNSYDGLNQLDQDLIERIKRAEFDIKTSRKGRTRNYAGFFEKNRLQRYVVNNHESSKQHGVEKIQTKTTPNHEDWQQNESKIQAIQLQFDKKEDSFFLKQKEEDIFQMSSKKQCKNEIGIEELLDRCQPNRDGKDSGSFYEVSAIKEIKPDFELMLERTPESIIKNLCRDSKRETTINGFKNTFQPQENEKISAFFMTNVFNLYDHSIRNSPGLNDAFQSMYSLSNNKSIQQHEFKNLVTPTKEIFDLSGRKFFDSKSSFKNQNLLSHFKSLDVSKSLDYS